MKMKKIVIEAEFLDFSTLSKMLKEILKEARNGTQYKADGIPFGMYVKQRYLYHLEYKEKTITEEKQIDGITHLIKKSKL